MNRRTFVTSIATGLLTPYSRQSTSTPAAPANLYPTAIDLGDGITLVDYRVHPGERASVIGEIRNDRDHMVDAPVVVLEWPEARSGAHRTWASPVIPVIEPGGTVPVFGPLPDSGESDSLLHDAEFSLCSPVAAGKYTQLQNALELHFRITWERYRHRAFRGAGIVRNLSSAPALQVAVRGIVRDGAARIAGVTPVAFLSTIQVESEKAFTLWMAESLKNKANPVPLISGLDYSVEYVVGTRGPAIAPGCTGDPAINS